MFIIKMAANGALSYRLVDQWIH